MNQLVTGTARTLEDYLNGTYVARAVPVVGLALGALTLDFTTPAVTVTFSGAPGDVFTLNAALAEIVAQTGSDTLVTLRASAQNPSTDVLGVMTAYRHLVVQDDAGFEIAETGTANALLGIITAVPIVSAGIIDKARIIDFTSGPAFSQLCVAIAP